MAPRRTRNTTTPTTPKKKRAIPADIEDQLTPTANDKRAPGLPCRECIKDLIYTGGKYSARDTPSAAIGDINEEQLACRKPARKCARCKRQKKPCIKITDTKERAVSNRLVTLAIGAQERGLANLATAREKLASVQEEVRDVLEHRKHGEADTGSGDEEEMESWVDAEASQPEEA